MLTKLTAKDVLNIHFDDMKNFDMLVKNLRESPYAKKGNPGNPGTDVYSSGKIQEKPCRALSKAD